MKTPTIPMFTNLGLLAAAALISTGAFAAQDAKPMEGAAIRAKVAMCIGCHGIPGYQSSFPEIHKVPMISGQNAQYIAAALQAYRKGDRKHPTMKGVAGSLTDDDITAISAFYEADGKNLPATAAGKPVAASPEVQALLTKGNCLACHGEGMNKPIDASYPKLAGQHADYLFVALKAYQTTGNASIGRANPIMAGQVTSLTLPELKMLANYIATLPGDLKVVPQAKTRR